LTLLTASPARSIVMMAMPSTCSSFREDIMRAR
jgi:hypothetical protein